MRDSAVAQHEESNHSRIDIVKSQHDSQVLTVIELRPISLPDRIMIKHARWYVNVSKWRPTREEWIKLNASIADEEVVRVNRFVYQDDSKSALIGRALIRKFVSHCLEVPSNQVRLSRNQRGRPIVCEAYKSQFNKNWPAIFDFNISHSGDYCILAGCWSSECPEWMSPCMTVGADVMRIVDKTGPDLKRFLELMSRREFSAKEWETVERVSSESQKCINFTRLWCLKESYIKSIGQGLSFNLRRLEFQTAESTRFDLTIESLKNGFLIDTTVLLDGQLASDWVFMETALDDSHLVALGYHFCTPVDLNLMRKSIKESHLFEELSITSLVDSLEPIDNNLNETSWYNFSSKSNKTKT